MKNEKNKTRRREVVEVVIGIFVALLILGAAGAGPALIDYYRFNQGMDKLFADNEANEGKWPQVQEACVLCHGKHGNAVSQLYARLAGQPAVYLMGQMQAFADGKRPNATMTPLAKTISANEVKRIADYFSAQIPAHNDSLVADPALVNKGEALVKAGNCAACHGPTLAGHDGFPRLSGQGVVYLSEQMHAFKSRKRLDPTGAMNTVAASLSDQAIEDLAQFLASR